VAIAEEIGKPVSYPTIDHGAVGRVAARVARNAITETPSTSPKQDLR